MSPVSPSRFLCKSRHDGGALSPLYGFSFLWQGEHRHAVSHSLCLSRHRPASHRLLDGAQRPVRAHSDRVLLPCRLSLSDGCMYQLSRLGLRSLWYLASSSARSPQPPCSLSLRTAGTASRAQPTVYGTFPFLLVISGARPSGGCCLIFPIAPCHPWGLRRPFSSFPSLLFAALFYSNCWFVSRKRDEPFIHCPR